VTFALGILLSRVPLELGFVNSVIVAVVSLLEIASFGQRRVMHDRLDPDKADALPEDLRRRTHPPVWRHQIGNVDLLRNTLDVVTYYPPIRDASSNISPRHV